jgi:hypothetical protein
MVLPRFQGESSNDGSFEFPAVVDGQWRVSGTAEISGVRVRGEQWIELVGRDLEDIKLQLNAPFVVHGKVLEQTSDGRFVPMAPSPAVSIRTEGVVGPQYWRLSSRMAASPSRAFTPAHTRLFRRALAAIT